MNLILKLVLAALVIVGVYLLTWPVPITPHAWDAPPPVPLEGVFAVNEALSEFQSIAIDGLHGPEAVIDDQNGTAYATTHEGWILRWEADGAAPIPERWVDVGGRPLGIAFDQAGNLWVANAYLGLQKVTPAGDVSLELDSVDGTPIVYADDLDITSKGVIYLSDASTKFSPQAAGGTLQASLLDINEHGPHGRIIEYSIGTGEARVVMRDLSFANGVALSPDQDFFYVAETGAYRIWRYWLQGERAGQSEVVINNLPGFPDNVHLGREGRFWVGLTSPRSQALDDLSASPFMRKIVQRLPAAIRPNVQVYGHVLTIDAKGEILNSFQDPNKRYAATTGAWETEQYVYVTSLTAPVLARYRKPQLGL